ncbi:multicopper oxidase [Suillus luteus UH-Slu-Lm8-n1]|uniref:Multicopper oxidase n=1 Tax=Suillus luteus UH-Slu-Lm8-n1 TaxID=930992 RepID=A0A0D0AD10_9AGAM|nr:multicopper oxidase [Suillus luteus UH-Slu-Lm8-n1]
MFIPILITAFVSLVNAASIVSRSQSYLQPAVLGPKTTITVGNKVIAPDGFERSATLVNGIFPGPLIAAQKANNFAIEVVNKLEDETMFKSTSIHWHGIFQNGTNYADGVSFVTQCPIAQNHSFLHSFSAPNQAGTYWYHSHYSVQYCDGLRGALVIYDPDDPLAHMYDVDDASTVITLSDWYHVVAPVLRHIIGTTANSSLINGLGRYAGGPASDLAVINVEQGKRYRMRLVAMSCDPNFQFSIDGHNLTVIEADGQLTEPLVVDELQILAGQRYSVVLVADKPVDNYWMRSLPSLAGASFVGGTNSAILRYKGASQADPTTVNTPALNQLVETNLHALINPGAPGIPGYGNADINLNLQISNVGGTFYVNGVTFKPPTVPVLLQILSGAQEPSQLLPNGSVIVLEANKVVELTLSIVNGPGGPHPIHLHGHAFDVIKSAVVNSTFNYVNPVRRDVVSAGNAGQQMVIRWTTDNSGPWFLHCHIDWHLDAGFAVVMAESPSDTAAHVNPVPQEWDQLCPIFDSLTPSQLGGGGRYSYEEAANISTLLFPPSRLPY